MRHDLYFSRLANATRSTSTDITPEKLAKLLETTLNKIGETSTGEQALKLVQKRLVKKAVRNTQ